MLLRQLIHLPLIILIIMKPWNLWVTLCLNSYLPMHFMSITPGKVRATTQTKDPNTSATAF